MLKIKRGDRTVEIPEISEAEGEQHEPLGDAMGIDDFHCLHMACKYADRFFDRVIGYRRLSRTQAEVKKGIRVKIAFYAEPSPRDWSPRKKPTRRRTD